MLVFTYLGPAVPSVCFLGGGAFSWAWQGRELTSVDNTQNLLAFWYFGESDHHAVRSQVPSSAHPGCHILGLCVAVPLLLRVLRAGTLVCGSPQDGGPSTASPALGLPQVCPGRLEACRKRHVSLGTSCQPVGTQGSKGRGCVCAGVLGTLWLLVVGRGLERSLPAGPLGWTPAGNSSTD